MRSKTVVGKLGGAWHFGGHGAPCGFPRNEPEYSANPIFRRTPLLDEENREFTETTIARSKDGTKRIVLLRPKRKGGRGKAKRGKRR